MCGCVYVCALHLCLSNTRKNTACRVLQYMCVSFVPMCVCVMLLRVCHVRMRVCQVESIYTHELNVLVCECVMCHILMCVCVVASCVRVCVSSRDLPYV